MKSIIIVVTAGFLFLAGCTHSFNDKNLRLVDKSINFSEVLRDPDSFIGRTVIAGGVVAGVHSTADGTLMEIVPYHLTADNVPDNVIVPMRRFFAATPEAASTADCRQGQVITLIGEVKGKQAGKQAAVYPLIGIREIHTWNNGDQDTFPIVPGHYDPYYWGYPDGQYLNRPIGPALKRY